ncbi:MAG TPA: hypothetical protein VF084_08860 [Nitrososphaeraceae archaeon]
MRSRPLRSPYYAGSFYPRDSMSLVHLLDHCFKESKFAPKKKKSIIKYLE